MIAIMTDLTVCLTSKRSIPLCFYMAIRCLMFITKVVNEDIFMPGYQLCGTEAWQYSRLNFSVE